MKQDTKGTSGEWFFQLRNKLESEAKLMGVSVNFLVKESLRMVREQERVREEREHEELIIP
ncbi:MAG: hypothetical protein GY696_16085 [Gammaproteobacteria bacterium]|nr:hypothetical protein [Gammaproteobacteria bacterium]